MLGTVLALAIFVLIVVVLLHPLIGLANELPGYEDRLQSTWRSLSQKFLKLQQSGESLVPRHPRQVRTVEGVPWERLAVGTAMALVALLGQATLALFVVLFFLAESGNYRRKIVRLFRHEPEGEDKVLTAIEQIHHDVEKYMLNRVVLNAILGVVTGVAFALYGLEHAAIWGLTWANSFASTRWPSFSAASSGSGTDRSFLAVPILSVLRIVSAHTPRLKWLGEFLAA